MSNRTQTAYLPNDVPPPGQLVLLGLQHVLTMFPATVFVALLTGFHVSTVLLGSGISTVVALLLSKAGIGKFIPLYYGSSFSYIAAYLAITNATFGTPASDELISTMQAGIIATGVLNVVVGFIIRAVGKANVDKVLPPVVTGSVAAVIGFALGFAALGLATGTARGAGFEIADLNFVLVALITLITTVVFSVYLRGKGFIGMLPILLGAIVGYGVSIPLGLVDFTPITSSEFIRAPHVTLPNFTSSLAITAIFSIAIMALATIPESTAHLYQISLYVDRTAEELGREKYHLDKHIGFNLILDGVGDILHGLVGATAGTNYGENNSLMAITRNYSGPALLTAGVIAILLAFVGTLAGVVQSVPMAVSGGLAIYLFGVIGMQGIALMIENKVNMFDPRQLAIGATILVIGVGGHIGYNGFLPIPILPSIFPNGLPAIAASAVLGILLNVIFLIFKPGEVSAVAEPVTAPGAAGK
ncbi:MAG TPA: solute carrier family 23 protein [Anaerolineae bacterium]|nr:solute carrier family 23 protein [Anaerolineae bacterium]